MDGWSSNVKITELCSDSLDCGGHFQDASGLLTSPSYPNLYSAARDCIYLVSQPNGTYIQLTNIEMDIRCDEMFGVESDHLEIRDGISEDSPLMGRFCGSKRNIPASMQTTQNYLRIRWKLRKQPLYLSYHIRFWFSNQVQI